MKFIADDGKVFEDYDECEKYETAQKNSYIVENWHNYVLMFDDEGTRISINTDVNEITTYLDEIEHLISNDTFYLIINKKCNWEPISKYLYEEYGLALPENTGIYRWDSSSEEWISFNEEVERLNNRWNPLGWKVTIQAKATIKTI